jgi:hypothetical protein
MAERKILGDAIHIRGAENFGLAHRAPPFGALADHQMAFARPAEHDFARAGNFEPLGHGLSGFNPLGTTHIIFLSVSAKIIPALKLVTGYDEGELPTLTSIHPGLARGILWGGGIAKSHAPPFRRWNSTRVV